MNSKSASHHFATPSMNRAWQALLEDRRGKSFRRYDLASVLYPLISPRSRPAANKIADLFITAAARSGVILKSGHVHWTPAASDPELTVDQAFAADVGAGLSFDDALKRAVTGGSKTKREIALRTIRAIKSLPAAEIERMIAWAGSCT